MTDATDHQTNGAGQGTATAGATKQRKTRSGLKIPQTGFAEVRELVDAMIALNGPASRNLIFDRAGKSSKGGAADARWSTLGYMGLREKTDDGRFVPPERAKALASGDPGREREAKQHALVETGFRPLIDRFSASPVNERSLALILKEDYDVPDAKAESTAALLVKLATEAEFIVDGRFKAEPIEQALGAVPLEKPEPKPRRSSTKATPKPSETPPASRVEVPNPQTPRPLREQDPPADEGQAGPFEVSVDISIEVDAKEHTPEEIGKIVREVREALTPTAG